ncbi:MAG: T9SS type A sorting domain-containing protein [Hymenobacter sp.]|nr:MAG: T9SS type A sorting domain-containing protein [Hymenobacter sp.]
MSGTSTFRGLLVVAASVASVVAAHGQQAPTAASAKVQSYLSSQRTRWQLSAADVADAAVTSTYSEPRTGLTHVYLRQRCQGLEVFGTESDLHLDKAGQVVSQHLAFVRGAAQAARSATPGLTPTQAVAAAAAALHIKLAGGSLRLRTPGEPAVGLVFETGPAAQAQVISVKLLYQALAGGELRLVWQVTLGDPASSHHWNARLDAQTGQLVDKEDLTISEISSFAQLAAQHQRVGSLPAAAAAAHRAPAAVQRTQAVNSYGVWPLTVESPIHGARQLVLNPADAIYSPYGWHDTNGVAGAEYTITRGNNAYAYEDRAGANIAGYSPDGGSNLEFDFPLNTNAQPRFSQDAALTNLFYWNNMVHDVMAYKGFFEAAGSFQTTNYSALGAGGDAVLAEAQDGSGTSNANFLTLPDGQAPRMQMFLWPTVIHAALTITTSSAVGQYQAVAAQYGKPLSATVPFTGQLALVSDATLSSLGCTAPLANPAALAGKIAVVDRGICTFTSKIRNAIDAGATGVIVINNIAGSPTTMASTDTVGIRIPAVMISQADGLLLKAALAGSVPVNGSLLQQGNAFSRDGDLDNGIIVHEYGHGISTRLTGGPTINVCLRNAEQMGEGWSDFFGLWMTTKPGDQGVTPRPIGNYVLAAPPTGTGIRTESYSTDFAVNDLTYALVGTPDYNDVHPIGEIWCATLWDLNWALINRYGYNTNLKGTTGGNNLALQLVLDGCKLQPCRPGFIDGRNAILKADSLFNGAANAALIWQVFARRGMGYGASQGSSNSLTDQVPSFALPPGQTPLATQSAQLTAALEVYPNPAHDQLTVRLGLLGTGPVQLSLHTLLGAQVLSTTVPAATLQATGARLATGALADGLYLLQLRSAEGVATKKVLIQH